MKRGNLHLLALLLLLHPLSTHRATAQLTPDNTLGAESSIVTPEATRQLIQGGATRGSNLFHSFTDFNVGENQRVYFANPTDMTNILTRVTGNNLSNILGTLGVDGAANLFLLNPNGIIFGPNAQLDIRGSFVATTADSILFDNNVAFSASDPQAPPLLTINVPIGLQYGSNSTATISNRGSLSVGGNLKLGAANLDLQGQLQAGGDLTLQATDTITIRDSETSPFIAAANGQLLVQGNEKVDIFALNHPDSGLYSGGDMVFRSANAVGGDAHYWSGGNFRIEDLQGNLGDLYSPYDPIIVATGDVTIDSYEGASLHILAAGSVQIGSAKITGPDLSDYTIYPGHPDPIIANLASVNLGDGTNQIIDGRQSAVLDVRAGLPLSDINNILSNATNPSLKNGILNWVPSFPTPSGSYTPTPSGTSLEVGTVEIAHANGLVFLKGNDININNSILASHADGGSNVVINASNNLNIAATINTSSSNSSGGNVTLIANDNIVLNNSNIITNSNNGNSGTVVLTSNLGSINLKSSNISTDSFVSGSGDIMLNASQVSSTGNIALVSQNDIYVSSGINGYSSNANGSSLYLKAQNNIDIQGDISTDSFFGDGGNVILDANRNILFGSLTTQSVFGNGGNISLRGNVLDISQGLNTSSILGNAGNIFGIANLIDVTEAIDTSSKLGNAGNIVLDARNLFIRDSLNSSSKLGNAGNVNLYSIQDNIMLGQVDATSILGFGGDITIDAGRDIGIYLSTINTASEFLGSGDIKINAQWGNLRVNNSFIGTETYGIGNAGAIALRANTIHTQNNAAISASTRNIGNAGKIDISAQTLTAETDSRIYSNTNNIGNAGQINFKIQDSLNLDRASVFVNTYQGAGNAGTINMNVGNLTAQNGTFISAASEQGGAGGNIQINAPGGTVNFIGNDPKIASPTALVLGSFGGGAAGNLEIDAKKIAIENGAQIYGSASRASGGNAANMTFNASESLQIIGTTPGGDLLSSISADTFGDWNAGNLSINTPQFIVRDGGRVSAGTTGSGNAGSFTVRSDSVEVTGTSANGQRASQVVFDSFGAGNAGQLKIDTQRLLLQNGGQILGQTGGSGLGGVIDINATEWARITGTSGNFASGLIFDSNGSGNARGIRLQTAGDLNVENGGKITVSGTGAGVSGDLDITARNIFLTNQGQLSASTRAAQGGNIRLQASKNLILRHNSEITAEAFGASTGGNIHMDVGGVISAVLSENSDIVASSESGQGGKIYSDAPALGFRQYNGRRTPESDFTAISEQGGPDLSGTVVVTRNVPPLVELPNRFAPPPLNEGCDGGQTKENSRSGRAEFYIPGRGGLPPQPTDMLGSTTVEIPWLMSEENEATASSPELVEATGWEKLPNGRIRLTAPDSEKLGNLPLACQLREEESKNR